MFIDVQGLSKDYTSGNTRRTGPKQHALNAVTLGAEKGSMLALVGASGSGKTTLLRCIAGLETPDTGRVSIGERVVFSREDGVDVAPGQRDLAMIFQGYALWPHLSVTDNVAYPLRRRERPEGEIAQRVQRYLDLVGCGTLGGRYPHELSGGQQQRIALARALVYEPAVVLFDEPLSNLDAALRLRLRSQIRQLQREVGFTGVYVTHDQEEAFYLGDHIALLDQGDLVQFGAPDDIYQRPATLRIAGFVGADNQLRGWLREGGRVFESPALGRIPVCEDAAGQATDQEATLAVRPECLMLALPREGAPQARVADRIRIGSHWEYLLHLPDGVRWRALVPAEEAPFAQGDMVHLALQPGAAMVFSGANA